MLCCAALRCAVVRAGENRTEKERKKERKREDIPNQVDPEKPTQAFFV